MPKESIKVKIQKRPINSCIILDNYLPCNWVSDSFVEFFPLKNQEIIIHS